MSLISVRNFVAPLQNRLHLGTIIMVAVLIAIARLSGAAFSVHKGDRNSSRNENKVVVSSEDDQQDTTQSDNSAALPSKASNHDPIDDLLEEPAKPADNSHHAANPQKPNQLSDIRKSLGLE